MFILEDNIKMDFE